MKKGLFLLAAIAAIALCVQAAFVPEDERALADRLFMHWQTHATDVYVRGEAVVGVGGARAEVPTVVFCGQRTHVTAYARPITSPSASSLLATSSSSSIRQVDSSSIAMVAIVGRV